MNRASLLMLCLFALASLSLAASDSLNMRTVGSWPYYVCRTISTTTLNGHDYAVGGFWSGIFIFNIDAPSTFVKISELAIPAALATSPIAYSTIDNGRAYLASGKTMTIVDLADPASPAIAGEYIFSGPGRIREITIQDTVAYLSCDSSGLRIVNVALPATPFDIGQYCPTDVGQLWSFSYKDTLGIVSLGAPRPVRVLNLAALAAPSEIGHEDYSGGVIRVRGDYAYLGYGGSIGVINISNPTDPVWVGNSGGAVTDRMVIADTILVGGYFQDAFLSINSISDPEHPSLLKKDTTTTGGKSIFDIAVIGHYLYIANSDQPQVQDITNPGNPLKVGGYRAPAIYRKGAISGGLGYFPFDGVHILNVADSSNPREIGYYQCKGAGVTKVAIKDSFVFAAELSMGLRILNVADPVHPMVVDSVRIAGTGGGLAVKDTFVYFAQDTLYIINVADVYSPFIVGKLKTVASASDVTVAGSIAYVVAGSAGLRIVDVSNAANPVELGFYDTPGNASDVAVRGTLAYVADGNSGLRVIDIADPANPHETGFWSPGYGTLYGGAMAVALDGDLAYVAYDTFGVRVVNISDPTHLVETGHYRYPTLWVGDGNTAATGVSVWNGDAYVSYLVHGLQVYHYYGPNGVDEISNDELQIANTLKPNRPNPFTASTAISYQLSSASIVTLIVYNVTGQRVRTLASGKQQAGAHEVRWNGRNDAGRQLSAGVYFCRLSANGMAKTIKAIKIQ